jgi:hypothetical protein
MSDRGGGFAQAGDMWPHKVPCGKTFSSNGADFCSFPPAQHWAKRYMGEPDTLRNDDVFESILLAARLLPAPTCLTSDNGAYVNKTGGFWASVQQDGSDRRRAGLGS